MKIKVLIIAILFGLLSQGVFADKKNDTLNIAWSVELTTLDQYFLALREGIIVGRWIWDSLLYKNPKTLKFEPLLAKSYRFVDSVTMEFELRRGIKFHNGEPFDADDVVYTLNFVSNPKNGAFTQRNVNWIERVEKLSKYKVRLKMKKPTATALEFLAGALPIYPNEYYKKVGPEGMGKAPIGTGPYKLIEFKPSVSMILERNDNYFSGGPRNKAKIKRMVHRTLPEEGTQIAELLSKRIDWLWRVPKDQAEKLAKRPGIKVVNQQTLRIGFLSFDSSNRRNNPSPVNNVLVRKAIAHAIDREAIVKSLVGGSSEVVHTACHPRQFGCEQNVARYEYNPAKAKKLLVEAGYPDGFTLEFLANRDRPYVEAMMGYLSEVGIKCNLVYTQYPVLRNKVHNGEMEIHFSTWGSYSIHDVSAITSNFFKATKDDYARDKKVVEDLTIGDNSVDSAERKAAYSRVMKRIADNVYWLPLFSYGIYYAFSDDLLFEPTDDEVPHFYNSEWR